MFPHADFTPISKNVGARSTRAPEKIKVPTHYGVSRISAGVSGTLMMTFEDVDSGPILDPEGLYKSV